MTLARGPPPYLQIARSREKNERYLRNDTRNLQWKHSHCGPIGCSRFWRSFANTSLSRLIVAGHQRVRLLHGLSRLIDEAHLNAVPPRAQLIRFIACEQRGSLPPPVRVPLRLRRSDRSRHSRPEHRRGAESPTGVSQERSLLAVPEPAGFDRQWRIDQDSRLNLCGDALSLVTPFFLSIYRHFLKFLRN